MTIKANNVANQGSQIIILPQSNIYFPPYPVASTFSSTLVKNTAYFLFLGQVTRNFTPLTLFFNLNAAGTGTVSHALGLFSSPTAPAGGNLTMTRLTASSTLTVDPTTQFIIKNTSNFSTSIAAGTFLWACYISAYGTTQTQLVNCFGDCSNGSIQAAASSSVSNVTTGGAISATMVDGILPAVCPYAYISL